MKDERPKEVVCMTKPDVASYCKRLKGGRRKNRREEKKGTEKGFCNV